MSELDEPVALARYNPDWPVDAAVEIARVTRVLDGIEVAVEHIGSTAVPGMAAKAIIDLQAGLGESLFMAAAAERLVAAGYEDMGEAGVAGRRYLRRRGAADFNVHLMQLRGLIWDSNLVLRDFLRAHPKEAREYAAAKRVALRDGSNLLAYSEAKAETLRRLLLLATAWSRGRR